MLLIYFWICEIPLHHISYHLDIPAATVSSWSARFCEYACIFYYSRNGDVIGGEEQIVEIDKAFFVKKKYHRGRLFNNQCWIFEGVVRGDSTQCFVEFVPNRSRRSWLQLLADELLQIALLLVIYGVVTLICLFTYPHIISSI